MLALVAVFPSIVPVFVGDDWTAKKGPGRRRDVWRMKGVYTSGARRACHLQRGAGREINKIGQKRLGQELGLVGNWGGGGPLVQ